MTKQLITLIGALITAVVLVAAVMIGVVPLVGGVFSADAQRTQVAATNQTYEMQIAALQEQQQRMGEIEAAVAELRAQVPDAPLLNQVFERIAQAEDSSGARVESVSRGDLMPYAPRVGVGEDAAPAAAATPDAEPTSETGTPIDAANDVAADANANSAATNAANGAPEAASGSAAASDRAQVEISITATADDVASAVAFVDALRTGPRAVAIDTVSLSGAPGAFTVQITALAFLQSTAQTTGAQ